MLFGYQLLLPSCSDGSDGPINIHENNYVIHPSEPHHALIIAQGHLLHQNFDFHASSLTYCPILPESSPLPRITI